jgi:TusA-related sulfurtransferase
MEISVTPDVTIDALGQYCPMPIILASKKIKQLEVGQVLEVLSDDAGIVKDMPAWCKSTQHEYIGIAEKDGVYRVYVRKSKP